MTKYQRLGLSLLFVFASNTFGRTPVAEIAVPISEAKVVVNVPAPMLTVQPSADLEFTTLSCDELEYGLSVKKRNGAYFLAVTLREGQMDCQAVPTEHVNRIRFSTDYENEPVYISNPLAPGPHIQVGGLAVRPSAIAVKAAKLHVWHGPRFAAVQPAAFVVVKMATCNERSLEAEVQEQNGILDVLVFDTSHKPVCFGPSVERTYEVQISSDYRGQAVRILNPIQIEQHL